MKNAGQLKSDDSRPRIFVLGSLNADFSIQVEAIPRAGESMIGQSFQLGLGGKGANQAVATARMGADVSLAGKVGSDVFGDQLLEALARQGLDVTQVRRDARVSTGAAFIMLEPTGQNRIVVVPGANLTFTREELDDLGDALAASDLLLLQLEMDLGVIERAVELAVDVGIPVILNPGPTPRKALAPHMLRQLMCITPNEIEAEALTGETIRTPEDAERAARRLRDMGIPRVVITMGAQGALALENKPTYVPACPVNAVDTVAAGDTFTGALAVQLCRGESLDDAVRFANAAAAITVTRRGAMASIPQRDEVERALYRRIDEQHQPDHRRPFDGTQATVEQRGQEHEI